MIGRRTAGGLEAELAGHGPDGVGRPAQAPQLVVRQRDREPLAHALVPEPDPAHSPVFQLMFNLVPAPTRSEAEEADGELDVRQLSVETGTAKFDLSLALRELASR